MNLKVGEYVVYGVDGVCEILGYEKKCFDGIHKDDYCKLTPVFSNNSVYYIPKDGIDDKVRKLIDKKDIDELIHQMPDIKALEIEDERRKKEAYSAVLRSGDYVQLISLMKRIYGEKELRNSVGKRLNSADERVIQEAENIMYQEFSIVLNITPQEVQNYISENI